MENNNTENYNTTAINNSNFLDLADTNNNNNKLNNNNYSIIKSQQLKAIKAEKGKVNFLDWIKASMDAKIIKVVSAFIGKEDESIGKRLINTAWAISRTSNTYDWAQAMLSKGIQDDFITPEDIKTNNKNKILSNYGLTIDTETNNINDEHYGILKQDNIKLNEDEDNLIFTLADNTEYKLPKKTTAIKKYKDIYTPQQLKYIKNNTTEFKAMTNEEWNNFINEDMEMNYTVNKVYSDQYRRAIAPFTAEQLKEIKAQPSLTAMDYFFEKQRIEGLKDTLEKVIMDILYKAIYRYQ